MTKGVVLQVAAKAVIVNKQGKVLLVREPAKNNLGSQHGLYGNPGGRIEPNEDYEVALRREVFEETGLEIEPLYPIYVGEWYPNIKGVKHNIVAIFTVCRVKTTKITLSQEHDGYKWIYQKDVDKYRIMPPEPEVIKRYAAWQKKLK